MSNTNNKELEEFYKKLGYTLIEIKSSVFREEESTFVFQTDNKNHTVDGSTILYDHAVTLHQELQKDRKEEKEKLAYEVMSLVHNAFFTPPLTEENLRRFREFFTPLTPPTN